MKNVLFDCAEENLEMEPGDVTLVIKAGVDGRLAIHHNIESLNRTGELDRERGDAAGFIMALSLIELLENDNGAVPAAVTRAMTNLAGRRFVAV